MLPKKNLKATIGKLLDVGRVQFDASFSWIFMSQVMIVVFAMVQRNAHEHMLHDFLRDCRSDFPEAQRATRASSLCRNYGRPEWTRTIDLFRVKEAL